MSPPFAVLFKAHGDAVTFRHSKISGTYYHHFGSSQACRVATGFKNAMSPNGLL